MNITSDSYEKGSVMFRCVQLSPGVFSSLEAVTMHYTNYQHFITERFYIYNKPIVTFANSLLELPSLLDYQLSIPLELHFQMEKY